MASTAATQLTVSDDGQAGASINIAVAWQASPGADTTTGTHTATVDASADWAAYTIEILPVAAAGGNPKGVFGRPLHGPLGGPI